MERKREKNKYTYLLKNTGLFAIASISTKLISFIFLPLYTAYLTTEEYAVVDLSVVLQALIWPILSLGITDAVLRFAMDKHYDKKKVFSIGIVIAIFGTLLAILASPFLKLNEMLYEYRFYIIVFYILVSINSYLLIFLRTINKVKLVVINSVISSFSIAGLNFLFLVVMKRGIDGYFQALIIGNAVSLLSSVLFGKLNAYFTFKFWDKNLIKEMLVYSLPMIPNSIFWWINSSLDKFYLTSLMGLTTVGLYSAAGKIPTALNMATSVFSQAWSMSAISEYNNEDSSKFFSNIFKAYNIMMLLGSSILVITAKPLASILLSKDFFQAWKYIPVLVVAFYFSAVNLYYGAIFTAYKKTNVLFWSTGGGAIVNLILTMVLILKFGIVGAAVSAATSNFIVYFIRKRIVKRYITLDVREYNQVASILILITLAVISYLDLPIILGVIFEIILVVLNLRYLKNLVYFVKNKLRV